MKYNKILAAIDFSEVTENVVRKAATFAKNHGSEIYVLHIVEPSPSYSLSGLSDVSTQLLEQAKLDILPVCTQYGVSEESIYTKMVPLKAGILEFIETQNIDLIFMGSHGKSGIARVLGSCTNSITHIANCDIYIVRTIA